MGWKTAVFFVWRWASNVWDNPDSWEMQRETHDCVRFPSFTCCWLDRHKWPFPHECCCATFNSHFEWKPTSQFHLHRTVNSPEPVQSCWGAHHCSDPGAWTAPQSGNASGLFCPWPGCWEGSAGEPAGPAGCSWAGCSLPLCSSHLREKTELLDHVHLPWSFQRSEVLKGIIRHICLHIQLHSALRSRSSCSRYLL